MNDDAIPVILLEDNHCLAIAKPAGLLTMGDDTGDPSAADLARRYLKEKYQKPGNVFLGVVHRLDRPVSGVVLFARTGKAASRLSDQFRRGAVQKTYIAAVEGCLKRDRGQLTDWLLKDRSRNHTSVVAAGVPGARESRLEYRVLSRDADQSLLEIRPLTGRSHQIRAQLARIDHPIVGDLKYGGRAKLGRRIMLHAARLEFSHPTLKSAMEVECQLPQEFVS